MSFIPVSDEQVVRFFKRAGATIRAQAARRLASRRARLIAASAAAVLTVAVGIALRPRPSEIPVQGLVLEIEELGIVTDKSGVPHCRVLVAVGDSTETTVLLPPPVPEVGHFIPLREGPSLLGKNEYRLDEETWAVVGPS